MFLLDELACVSDVGQDGWHGRLFVLFGLGIDRLDALWLLCLLYFGFVGFGCCFVLCLSTVLGMVVSVFGCCGCERANCSDLPFRS